MLNQTIITGHLGDDPKEFFSADEIPVTSFDLAFQAAKKDLLDQSDHISGSKGSGLPSTFDHSQLAISASPVPYTNSLVSYHPAGGNYR
jgi:hypothetical protein